MRVLWPAVGVLLVSCSGDEGGYPPGARVASVVMRTWSDAGLPKPLGGATCGHLDGLEVWAPSTAREYAALCPEASWACQVWTLGSERRVRATYHPVAVLHPDLPASLWASQAIHEMLHALGDCSIVGVDYDHLDPRVWESGGEDSVERRAFHRLYGR